MREGVGDGIAARRAISRDRANEQQVRHANAIWKI
jgi:hypothetical protein